MLRSEVVLLVPGAPIALSECIANSSACTDRLWDKLCRSPSAFGRLVSIAEMWNSQNGRYESPLCSEYGSVLVDLGLREIHREIFVTWLSFRLQQQERDLTVWLASLNHGVADGIHALQAMSKRLTGLLPLDHIEPERLLFLQNFQLVSTMVRWGDVEDGIRFSPGSDEGSGQKQPTLASRARAWFRPHSAPLH
jgi:hypothetical protein